MSHRSASRVGLGLVGLGILSVVIWWLRESAPEAGERESAKPAATAAAETAPVLRASSDVSDRSDTSDSAVATATPTRPAAAPLTASNEGLVALVPTGVQDRYAQNEVLDERTSPTDAPGQYERVRIVRTSMKYPLVRVEERWQVAGGRFQEAGDRRHETGGRRQGAEFPEPRTLNPSSSPLTPDTCFDPFFRHPSLPDRDGRRPCDIEAQGRRH